MTFHVLVEGPSERVLIEGWFPRLRKGERFRVYPHQGKGQLPDDLDAVPRPERRGLLDQLPGKLRGFASALDPNADRVIVLLDADDQDPDSLLEEVESAAKRVAPELEVLVRLAVEETEAFYLGDLAGLKRAFPAANMEDARAYVPDSIRGTWELFGRVIGDGGGNKVAWAEAMAPVLTTNAAQSRSPSFKRLVSGLLARSTVKPRGKKRQYRHPPRPRRDPSGKR